MSNQRVVITIIEKNKKVLLLKEKFNKSYEKSKGKWTLPGGKAETNESIISAALRELKEETGIKNFFDFDIGGLFFIRNRFIKNDYLLGVSFFSKSFPKEKIKVNNRINFQWLSPQKIKKLKLRRHIKMVIKNYERYKI